MSWAFPVKLLLGECHIIPLQNEYSNIPPSKKSAFAMDDSVTKLCILYPVAAK